MRRGGPWLVFLLAVGDWAALKTGLLSHPAWILGLLVVLSVLSLTLSLITTGIDLARGRQRPGRGVAGMLFVAGVVAALVAGSANWLLGLQGFVILHEGESVPLHAGSHLQHFEGGPLSRLAEMDLVLGLEQVEIVPAGGEYFYPRSRLVAQRAGADAVTLNIDRSTAGRSGSLRFYQGAFGFAPRIVILHQEETVLDRVIPFRSARRGPAGISFEERFTVEREALDVRGRIDLASLDPNLRGHASLELDLSRNDRPLGRGSLLPGHFAEVGEGYRVGFAGLKKWSEIDVSRRNYARPVLGGCGLALIGAMLWPLAWWRGW